MHTYRLLVAFDKHKCHEALKDVEWDTLLFFAALFVFVEALGELGMYVCMCVCMHVFVVGARGHLVMYVCMHVKMRMFKSSGTLCCSFRRCLCLWRR